MRRKFALGLSLAAALCATASALAPETRTTVKEQLRNGSVDVAIQRLDAAIGANPADAEAHQLLCRVYYGEEQWDAAIAQCEQAVALDPRNSSAHLWLGRTEGEKADRAPRLVAFGMARKVRAEFEKAVDLDGRNEEALSDLGEYYATAPAIVGGGIRKAEAVAKRLDSVNRARAEELRGRIANAQRDPVAAEQHFRTAVEASSDPAGAWMDLASFYARQHNWDGMEAAVRAGLAADSKHDAALVDGARVLLRSGRDLPLAKKMLTMYLDSQEKSASEPAYRVHALLGRAFAQQGDTVDAGRQFAAATALASGFHPATTGQSSTGR
jgi:tetratricopeptide (TPR) repeat protein